MTVSSLCIYHLWRSPRTLSWGKLEFFFISYVGTWLINLGSVWIYGRWIFEKYFFLHQPFRSFYTLVPRVHCFSQQRLSHVIFSTTIHRMNLSPNRMTFVGLICFPWSNFTRTGLPTINVNVCHVKKLVSFWLISCHHHLSVSKDSTFISTISCFSLPIPCWNIVRNVSFYDRIISISLSLSMTWLE